MVTSVLIPQTDLLFSRAEHEDFVRFVLQQGAWLVPSSLSAPGIEKVMDIDAYRRRVDGTGKLFHIQHHNFDQAPLEVRSVRSAAGEEKFYVALRSGGPTVDLLGPYEFEEDGVLRVAGGFIAHYPTFWNPITRANESAPAGQKALYRTLLNYIGMNAAKVKAGKRSYWIGLSTLARFRDGLVALPSTWTIPLEI